MSSDECADATHEHHDHAHGPECGHVAIEYDGEICYLHDGHLHKKHGEHYHCVRIEFSEQNPDGCNPIESQSGHVHGPECGHELVPHGDHFDYLVDGRLYHQHGDHIDDHGPVKTVK